MKTAVLLPLLLAIVACGADEGPADLPEPMCISEVGTPAPDFVGLTEEEARDLAEERGLEVRVVGRDGECFVVTQDFRENRVNLELSDGVVIGAGVY